MLKKSRKQILTAVLAVAVLITPVSPAAAAKAAAAPQGAAWAAQSIEPSGAALTYEETKKVAQQKASSLTLAYGADSVQYALIDNGTIVVSGSGGYNDKTAGTKITAENMYTIASISKIFTTTAVLQLAEAGKLDLDTPVVTYIPQFSMKDSRYRQITPRMLLNHSSGLMGTTQNNMLLFKDTTPWNHDHFLELLKEQRLKADPGKYSVYCNDGFTLAEILVEKVSGQTFSDYIAEHITKPLSMNHTKTPQDKFNKNLLAKIYETGEKKPLPYEAFSAIGAGGIYSSAEDLCRFSQIFTGDTSLLSDAALAAMETEEGKKGLWPSEGVEDTNLNYGLGWDCIDIYPFNQYEIKALQKGGDSMYCHGSLLVLPEKGMAAAVLTSGGSSAYNQVAAQEIMLAALKEKGEIDEIKPDKKFEAPVQKPLPAELKKYEGYYGSMTMTMKVELSDEGVMTLSMLGEAGGGQKQKLIYTGDGRFSTEQGNGYAQFMEDASGTVYLFNSGYATAPGLGQFASSSYLGQKLEPVTLPKSLQAFWNKREKSQYLCISERYSSQSYVSLPSLKIELIKDLPGYFYNSQITDKNNAKAVLMIPGTGSRDLNDFRFYTKNKKNYMALNNSTFISTDSLSALSAKKSSKVKLAAGSDSQWYKLGAKTANKRIAVTVPKQAAFMVYDKEGKCINNSHLTGKKTVKLPKNGYIGFVGNKNAVFQIKLK